VQRPDLQLTLTGKGSVSLEQEQIGLRGSLRADQGRVQLRDGTTPTLGDDVVIVGSKPRSPLASRVLRTALDLSLDLGPDFRIHGRGLDARLEGQLKLVSPGNAPITAEGKISVARGSFEAYNRLLDIETGALYFSGPVDNPGLNIRAMRKNQQVEAGVEITGTARAPRVRLVSNPDVPDSEKLSWLVLGRKADAGSQSDSQALQRSGAALLVGLGASPLQTQLRQTAGLDELTVAPGESAGEGGIVTLGKRISDRIYVIFEQDLSSASNTLKVNYQLSRRWSLRSETGKTDALDLFYSFSFD
jgi:translocation and assembly module TamB